MVMNTVNPHIIRDVESLRSVIGETHSAGAVKVRSTLDEFSRDFLNLSPFLVLSSADSKGNVDASPKGDAAGFVHIENDSSIVIPDRPGNR